MLPRPQQQLGLQQGRQQRSRQQQQGLHVGSSVAQSQPVEGDICVADFFSPSSEAYEPNILLDSHHGGGSTSSLLGDNPAAGTTDGSIDGGDSSAVAVAAGGAGGYIQDFGSGFQQLVLVHGPQHGSTISMDQRLSGLGGLGGGAYYGHPGTASGPPGSGGGGYAGSNPNSAAAAAAMHLGQQQPSAGGTYFLHMPDMSGLQISAGAQHGGGAMVPALLQGLTPHPTAVYSMGAMSQGPSGAGSGLTYVHAGGGPTGIPQMGSAGPSSSGLGQQQQQGVAGASQYFLATSAGHANTMAMPPMQAVSLGAGSTGMPGQASAAVVGGSLAPGTTSMYTGGSTSVYVKNLPPEADRLWMYERFAPHGAILSAKVLVDENSGRCRGVGFVNYVKPTGAMRAVQALHGNKLPGTDRALHVSLQTPRTRTGMEGVTLYSPPMGPPGPAGRGPSMA